MHILEGKFEHLDDLTTLFDAYRVFYGKQSDPASAHQFLADRIRNQESKIFLAKDPLSDKLVGFTQLYPLFSSTRMGKLWLLNDLFVDPAFRGQGISILLIERAKQLARETKAVGIALETEQSNKIGNQLYPRTGFTLEEGMNHYFWSLMRDATG